MQLPYINKQRLFIVAGGIVVILSIVIALVLGFKKPPPPAPKIDLTVWGVFDSSDVYKELFQAFTSEYKKAKVSIQYRKIPVDTYEAELTNALAEGRGPDIFMIHNTWVDKHRNKMLPAPGGNIYNPEQYARLGDILSVTPTNFKETFVDVTAADLIRDEQIYSLPLYVDTLALFYNKQMFNDEGIPETARTWDEFINHVTGLTKFTPRGAIERSGVALGTADNINRAQDILSLLMLQNGTVMNDAADGKVTFNQSVRINDQSFSPGEIALDFYTSFANPREPVFTWDNRAPYSIDAFVEGDTAMMFNYSYTIPTLRRKAPYLNFDVAPMPQTKNAIDDPNEPIVNFATYWTFAVSRQSGIHNPSTDRVQCAAVGTITSCEVGWDLLLSMAGKERTRRYLDITQRPSARRDLINEQREDPDLGVFALQSLTARSWRQPDNTVVDKVFNDMINSVNLNNKSIKDALKAAVTEINLLIRKE